MYERNKNAEKQRRYMERLQKPENKDELIACRQKRNARLKELRHAKQANEESDIKT